MSLHRRLRAALPGAALLTLALPVVAAAATVNREAETLAFASSAGMIRTDASASGGKALMLWSTASAGGSVTTAAARRLSVRVRGDQCNGAPEVAVDVDSRRVLTASVPSTTWTTVAADVSLADGAHSVVVRFTNDATGTGCDRNLHVDRLAFTSTAATPLRWSKLYVAPGSDAAKQAAAWRLSRPADAAVMDRLAAQPAAKWLGAWSGDVRAAVDAEVTAATAAGAVPTLVAYDIPQRDCGGLSAGGSGSADAYRVWIRAFASGIGTRRAIVVIEPDALALTGCLSAADRDTRFALLRDAVSVLAAKPGASVYLDAGHSAWLTTSEAAARLVKAGAENAQGFSLNVSNFRSTAELLPYARALAEAAGGKHYVLDTSRNGLGPAPDGQWCNPGGRALGAVPSTWSAESRLDATLWIKRPGESDGTCNGGPVAGAWWPDYALGLARAAGW